MAERDELALRLAQVRKVLVAPVALKGRVLEQLLPSPAGQGDAALGPRVQRSAVAGEGWLASARHRLGRAFPSAAVAVLVGLAFGAGFWLGRRPVESDFATLPAPSVTAVTSTAVTSTAVVPIPTSSTVEHSDDVTTSMPNVTQTVVTQRPRRPAKISAVQGRVRPRGSSGPIHPGDDALSGEIALLARVERAIRSGEAYLALALLDDLDRDFPLATLSHERAAAQVLARCIFPAAREPGTLERRVGRSRAERFLAEHEASVYSDRIRSACELEEGAEKRATSSSPASKKDPALDTQRTEEHK